MSLSVTGWQPLCQVFSNTTFAVTFADDAQDADRQRTAKRLSPVNPDAPTLTKADYFTVPPIKRLRRMTDNELQVTHLYWTSAKPVIFSQRMRSVVKGALSQTHCIQ